MSDLSVENDVNRCRQCGTPVRDNYDLCDTHDSGGGMVLGCCGICGGPLAKVGTSRCYEAHGVIPPVNPEGGA